MKTQTRTDRRRAPDLDGSDPNTNTMSLPPTVLSDELQLDDSAAYDCDPYNSAPCNALERKRNAKLP